MKSFVKSILSLIFCLGIFTMSSAQDVVKFTPNNLSGEDSIKADVYVSTVLTAINQAYFKQQDLEDINNRDLISQEAWNNIKTTWKTTPFYCPEPMVVESVEPSAAHPKETEIRHIPLRLVTNETDSWKNYQEATIRMDKNGRITYFALSLDAENYAQIMSDAQTLSEIDQYSMILDYLERFRNAYCLKDIKFLEQVYSDDALIVTGTVITSKKSEMKQRIKYTKYSKTQYIDHLRSVFKRNEKINVAFDSITVKRHPAIEGIYGVQLFQGYQSSTYSDVGYLFLLWDFRDEERPQIHIRTWQDARIWEDHPEEEKYDINSFDIEDF